MQSIKRDGLRKLVDLCMLILLLCLMSYQVTGGEKHEWTGVLMTMTVILHQVLNRRWYAALFKGRYNVYRGVTTAVRIVRVLSSILPSMSGICSPRCRPISTKLQWLMARCVGRT